MQAIDSFIRLCYNALSAKAGGNHIHGNKPGDILAPIGPEPAQRSRVAVAGMLSGLRIVLESFLFIPLPFLGPNLEFTLTFLPNALGGMYYGPAVALLTGAVTDLLSWLLVSKGPFFPSLYAA